MFPDLLLEDKDLREEIIQELKGSEGSGDEIIDFLESPTNGGNPIIPEKAQAIVRYYGRPVLFVENDTFENPKSDTWADRLNNARTLLDTAIRAVGRIEVNNHPRFKWVGTGWLVAEDIIVTNRHVATEFAYKDQAGDKFVFRQYPGYSKVRADINFKGEKSLNEQLFSIVDVLYIAEDSKTDIDLALLRVARQSSYPNGFNLSQPIQLSSKLPSASSYVAVIGYPARSYRTSNPRETANIFGDIYDIKRLAPGQIIQAQENVIFHDCTTLGGNSGSPVLDLNTGEAVGIHYAGQDSEKNLAVPSPVLADLLLKYR